RQAFLGDPPVGEQRPIVVESVEPDLEATVDELAEDAWVDLVPGAEVERRPEAVLLLQVGDLERTADALVVLDVVGQDHRRLVAVRPEPEELALLPPPRSERAADVEAKEAADAAVDRPRRK